MNLSNTFRANARTFHAATITRLLTALIAIGVCASFASAANSFIHQACIDNITGKVEIQSQGKGAWNIAQAGAKVTMEDRVRTSASSSCRLLIGDIGGIELAANTEARLGSLRQVREANKVRDVVVVHLERGLSRQSFTRKPGREGDFKVATPIAVAGVRGTCFELGLDDQLSNLTCAVLEGLVELQGSSNGQQWSKSIAAGSMIMVKKNAPPPDTATPVDTTTLQRLGVMQNAIQQDTTSLGIIPEMEPGSTALEIAPASLTYITAGAVEKIFEKTALTISGAGSAKKLTISFGGTTAEQDVTLEVGKDFSFTRTFEAIPVMIEASGKVSSSAGKTIIEFTKMKIKYIEEAAMDVYRIPCFVVATPGGAGSFTIIASPGDEREIE